MRGVFIHDDFLLGNEPGRLLYHRHAEAQPILDFHNHLPPQLIAENHVFTDLTELWLAGDHYKWRALRANGVAERFITGDASPREKFQAWAATVPFTLGNPLYHWTHLELKRDFGLDLLLNESNADEIWEQAQARLPQLGVHDLLRHHRVEVLCTTDDPADALQFHQAIIKGDCPARVYPTFRPDKALQLGQPVLFNNWLGKLEEVTGSSIQVFDDLLNALKKRHEDFHAIGCRLSDHGLETAYASPNSFGEAARIFSAARAGKEVSAEEQAAYASHLMLEFGRWDAARGWTKQLHLGALRNTNSRRLKTLGPDTGFDSIGDFPQARNLAAYLSALDETDELPRVIIYNLNPADNYLIAAMIGNFQGGAVPGKIQMGSGWWFLDQKEGMEWQMNALAQLGLLRRFVGMVTDSRSFLSFPRHEYFRRVLCHLLGQRIESGELPNDFDLIGAMVREICGGNARHYLNFPLETKKDVA